jgi:hypothetical protein
MREQLEYLIREYDSGKPSHGDEVYYLAIRSLLLERFEK